MVSPLVVSSKAVDIFLLEAFLVDFFSKQYFRNNLQHMQVPLEGLPFNNN